MPGKPLKLTVDPLPTALYGKSLHALARSRWRKLRDGLIEDRGAACSYCGAKPERSGDIHGHEVWDLQEDGLQAVATLERVDLICVRCHAVEHLGNTVRRIQEGSLPPEALDQLIGHFCEVNGVTPLEFEAHATEAQATLRRRHQLAWTLDYGEFRELI